MEVKATGVEVEKREATMLEGSSPRMVMGFVFTEEDYEPKATNVTGYKEVS